MSRGAFIKTCVLIAVTTHAHAQYLDFFNSFLQPITTSKPRHAATKRPDTKHRQTNKQKIQDIIFFDSDEIIKQRDDTRAIDPFNFYTTAKPKSKARTTSQTTIKPKNVNSNKIINNNRNSQEVAGSINNNNNNVESRVINNGRRIENNYDIFNNVYDTTKANKQTTDYRPTFGRQTTRRPNYNKQTTKNPLLNRPGVKPAVADHNRPPITNRPVTESPYDRPVYNKAADRPVVSYDATYSPDPRPPVNTRPPFETERPMDPGVVSPVNVGISNENTEVNIEIGPDEGDMSAAEKRRLYEVCEKKCDEYKSMRVRKIVALPLAAQRPRAAEVNVSSCAPDNVPLIIGGQLAKIETFPHMALLGWKLIQSEGYAWKCGGSLISEDYVLTAGHCTYHDKDYNVVSGPPGAVQLGSSIYNDRTATVVRVSLVVRHPKYKLRRSYYDVALLKLAVTVSFSETISPACLGVPPAVGEPVIATGWGRTEFGGDSSIQLRSVSIPIWDMNDCRDIWGTSLKLPNGPMPDNQVCAGEKEGAKDTCQGDSGGPAQVRDGCSWRVVAVTSVGRSCGAPETPALYALVPRAFVAKQVFTNSKPGRDGNNQYGNTGVNGNNNNGFGTNNNGFGTNNNGFGTNNNGFGTNNNGFGTNNNGFGNNNNGFGNNNNRFGTNNNGFGNNNNGFGTNNNGFGTNNNGFGNNNNGFGTNNNEFGTNNNGFGANNNGFASNNNGFGNDNWNTVSNNGNGNRFGGNERGKTSANANSGAVNTRPNQDTRRTSNNNNQYYSDSQGSGTNERGTVSNYNINYNNRAAKPNNNYSYNQNNRNVNDYNNGQTTNNYQSNYGQGEQSQRGRTAEIRSDTTNYGYNNGNNAYGAYTDNSWWTR